jgi:hypothetical protein
LSPSTLHFCDASLRIVSTPTPHVLEAEFGLVGYSTTPLPASPGTPADVFAAAFRAWLAINDRIGLGRGREFCLGHGVLLQGPGDPKGITTVTEALAYVSEGLNVADFWYVEDGKIKAFNCHVGVSIMLAQMGIETDFASAVKATAVTG